MAKNITIFTRTDCPYCELLKRFLDMKKTEYKSVNIDEDGDAMAKVMSMTGRAIAPTTVVSTDGGAEEVIVGYNLGGVMQALAK